MMTTTSGTRIQTCQLRSNGMFYVLIVLNQAWSIHKRDQTLNAFLKSVSKKNLNWCIDI